MKNTKIDFTVIQDTREQTPFIFGLSVPVEIKTLKQGDYSIKGYEDVFAVERKSINDLAGTLTGGHTRFLKEMERLRDYESSYIVIEGEFIDLCKHLQRFGSGGR